MDAPFPRPGGWDRLETYARRVRTLVCNVDPFTGNTVALMAFQTIAQFRPSGKDLLPNLRGFTYNASELEATDALPPLLTFLGPSVVELKLQINPVAAPSILEYLPQRAPQVQHLRIEGFYPITAMASSSVLASSLIQLKKLNSLSTSDIALTPAVWDAIAQHPSLVFAALPLWTPSSDTIGFQPRTFAKLENLVVSGNFDRLCGLFESQDVLPTLTCICFRGRSMKQERSDFRRLCELLAQKLPILASVKLVFYAKPWEGDTALGFEDFRPLLQSKRLQRFQLEHPCGVSVTAGEVSELLDAWPGISTLALQYATSINDPLAVFFRLKRTPPTLPLNILDTVAAKAPRIKELGLVLDATTPINSTLGICQQHFECLQVLEVTLSTIGQPGDVASYLAQLCKRRFSLKFLPPHRLHEDTAHLVDEEKKKWDQAKEYLRLLLDQKERLEEGFERRLKEERARSMRE
ncbi:hypothetical protein FS837_006431 [Tulasnella sp. UAMH 9824]|nr:hypothetical protein FS837_006431 [Tulasnella sp. UAMH 9824]